jgi:hypothetical protein
LPNRVRAVASCRTGGALMAGRLRIFVASTMDYLPNEREMVVDRLNSFNFEPVNAEKLLPSGATSWGRISEELKDSPPRNYVVLSLGFRG